MKDKIQSLIQASAPFMAQGIFIAIFIGILFMFTSILTWGILIGAILWFSSFIYNLLFSKKPPKEKGRVIEHNDKR